MSAYTQSLNMLIPLMVAVAAVAIFIAWVIGVRKARRLDAAVNAVLKATPDPTPIAAVDREVEAHDIDSPNVH